MRRRPLTRQAAPGWPIGQANDSRVIRLTDVARIEF